MHLNTARFQRTLAFALLIALLLGLGWTTLARAQSTARPVKLIMFWGEGCPHCAEAKPFLEGLQKKYPNLELDFYEVRNNEDNRKMFEQIAQQYGIEASGVPTIFIDDKYWVGFNNTIGAEIETTVEEKSAGGDEPATQPVVLTMFWGDGCPHCAEAKPFLEGLKEKYPTLQLDYYEVWYNDDNLKKMQDMAKQYGFEASGVPTIFIGDKHWVGFNDEIGKEIEATIQAAASGSGESAGQSDADVIKLPLIGNVSLKGQSLLVSTLLISFVDGVNPCSVWVLTMLLALTLHTGSRKKVLVIGLIFLTVTAAIYALFITGLFTILKIASFTKWIQVIVALFSLFFAFVNIKDYFWYKEGVSFTIDDSKKPGIFKSMRRVMDASESFWGMAGATVVLAAGVSLVEFSCTAGFPVLWTNLLTAQGVTTLTFIGLLLVYMLIYQLDEMVIFGTAVFSLKASKLEEKHGRILKLIGGMLMLTLAAVMLIKPALMSDLGDSLVVFAVAAVATLLVLLLHRKVLPAFGIWIGSEKAEHRKGAVRRRH